MADKYDKVIYRTVTSTKPGDVATREVRRNKGIHRSICDQETGPSQGVFEAVGYDGGMYLEVVYLSRLHMRPIQMYLMYFGTPCSRDLEA